MRSINRASAVLVSLLLASALTEGSVASASTAGELDAFGADGSGQLASTLQSGLAGAGEPASSTPSAVELPGASGAIVQIAAGESFSLALTATGQLYAFGDNQYGQLASTTNNGSEAANPTPTLVHLPDATAPVMKIAAGASHSLALTRSGQLYTFGSNRYGQLGYATDAGSQAANPTPTLVELPGSSGEVIAIAAGADYSLALTSSGQLYTFGANRYGQLGRATNNGSEAANPQPEAVSLPNGGAISIAAGNAHTLVLSSAGEVYSFGSNRYGQLGRAGGVEGTGANPAAREVTLPSGAGAASEIAAGGSHSLVIAGGQLYSFGDNEYGQLGVQRNTGSESANALPAAVSLPGASGGALAIAAGASDSLAITSSGELFSFGSNLDGQLGSGEHAGTSLANATARPVALAPGTTIDSVASGSSANHTLALVADLSVLSGALPSGRLDLPYSTRAAAGGGGGGYLWSASGLPPGLRIDPASGEIAGTPTSIGTSEVVLEVSDGFGVEARSAPLALSIAPLATATPGFLYSTLSEAELRASLRQQLTIKGSSARIATLRRRAGITYGFTALTAGVLAIDWYYLAPGAQLARRAKPVLVAAGRRAFAKAGTRTITLRLTRAGSRLLAGRRRIALTARGSFTPLHERAVTARARFTLRR